MQHIIEYKNWHIIVARNYSNTTINVYSDQPPVKQFTAQSIEQAKQLVDEREV